MAMGSVAGDKKGDGAGGSGDRGDNSGVDISGVGRSEGISGVGSGEDRTRGVKDGANVEGRRDNAREGDMSGGVEAGASEFVARIVAV